MRERLRQLWTGAAQENTAQRKTALLPSVLTPYGGAIRETLPKPTPMNLRRFAETPVARRAINCIKDRIASMDWQVRLKRGFNAAQVENANERMAVLRAGMEEPNANDSFRTLCEQVLEDLLVGGFGAIEMETTEDEARPFQLWPVDGATIQINLKWDGSADSPRYAQATGKIGKDALIPLLDDELIYIRQNPRTYTPFGLGRLEVAFETIN
ncbi:MAG TPA: phage portal protein, partial [Acidobacteriaceae bacterium]|nr:phage portal protein [Acidobacteriaceae bacterium]